MKKIRSGSLAEQVLVTLAQSPMVTRKMLGAIMYYYDEKNDRTVRYTERPQALARALTRVKEAGFVSEVKYDKRLYLYLTDTGSEYLESIGLSKAEKESRLPRNENIRKRLAANSAALYVGRSMRVFSLPEEKPSFAELATMMGSETNFGISVENAEQTFSKDEVENEILPYGICYSKNEIRQAYEYSENSALFHNTSRRVGMIFKSNSVTTVYLMDKKTTAFWPRIEQTFNQLVAQDLAGIYDRQPTVKRVAYILSDSFISLPSLFHGCVDGVEKGGSEYRRIDNSEMSILKIDKLLDYNEVYLMPKRATLSQYREDLDAYNESMEQEDYDNFCDTHPQVEGRVVIARYPNLVKLRTHYKAKDAVVLVGYGDPLIVDMLSRCMRTCLKAYYDIETGKSVPFTRYSNTGRPLVGNTNQIDHSKRAKINGKDFWDKSSFV